MSMDIHMAGLNKPTSQLSFTKDTKAAVVVSDHYKVAVIGHKSQDGISYAKVGEKYYILIADGCHNTAILCDEYGLGSHPCHTNSVYNHIGLNHDAKWYGFKGRKVIYGTSLEDLDASEDVKEELTLTLAKEWLDMARSNMIWRSFMDISEEDYHALKSKYENILSEYEALTA